MKKGLYSMSWGEMTQNLKILSLLLPGASPVTILWDKGLTLHENHEDFGMHIEVIQHVTETN